MNYKQILIAVIVIAGTSCTGNDRKSESPVATAASTTPQISYTLVKSFPHDTTSFTEGFVMHDGKLYESTGSPEQIPHTRSLLGVVNLQTGNIDVKVELDRKQYFGEGIVFLKDKVYQLTYMNRKGFIYDARTFKKLGEFVFPSREGWGMTTDGRLLIMSDGSSILTWLDPEGLKPVKTVNVMDENGPVKKLNELEYINGYIYANVYETTKIIKIDPADGKVLGRLDLYALENDAKTEYGKALEMNGIAYDSVNDRIYITGKMWPDIYQIRFSH
jgi:glutamine cyclotransferase